MQLVRSSRRQHSFQFVKAACCCISPPYPSWPAHCLRRNLLCSFAVWPPLWGDGCKPSGGLQPKNGTQKRSRRRDSPRSWGSSGELRGFFSSSLRGQAFPSWPHHSPALAPCKCSRPLPHPALPGKLSPTNRLSSWLPLVSRPPRVGGGPMRVEFTYCGGSGWPCSL